MKQKTIITLTLITILLIASFFVILVKTEKRSEKLLSFSSLEELKEYLKEKSSANQYSSSGFLERALAPSDSQSLAKATFSAEDSFLTQEASDYSTTNIQVKGVDEPDIVKNNGKHIFIISGENISIVDAYPVEQAKLISIIDINGSSQELFLSENKLIVFGQENYIYGNPEILQEVDDSITKTSPQSNIAVKKIEPSMILPPVYKSPKSFIKVYDVSNVSLPILEKSIFYDGDYYDARMIDNKVYVILNQPLYLEGEKLDLPYIQIGQEIKPIEAKDISYFNILDSNYYLTTVLSLNLNNLNDIDRKTFLTGYTQTIFVSRNNFYLTATKYLNYADQQLKLIEKVILDVLPEELSKKGKEIISGTDLNQEKSEKLKEIFENYYNTLPEEEKSSLMEKIINKTNKAMIEIQKEFEKTVIYKISLENLEYKGKGEVPGHVLNQFSMDEHHEFFRIATTLGETWNSNSINNLYILDENLEIIGSLENLAKGERIYSVRFIVDRAYLVTFKKVDPFFVIDLSDPRNPVVLGELKITGYSDYLHPYDSTHIIGIGKEAIPASEKDNLPGNTDFAWYQGIKLSLFDVSDVSNPKEISRFNIGDRGSESLALHDHKAFLFDKEKELLVIPISLREIKREQYPYGVPSTEYGDLTFEGAYALGLNIEDGFTYKGRISHLTSDEQLKLLQQQYTPVYDAQIQRSLYIGNVLYTISQRQIKAHDLSSLQELANIKLPTSQPNDVMVMY